MLIHRPTCQFGQTTREEYRAGIRRPLCSSPSTTIVEAGETRQPGNWHLCDTHAGLVLHDREEEADISRPFDI